MALQTGNGAWDPLLWATAFAIIVIIVLIIRAFGVKTRSGSGAQGEQFFSGNEPPKGQIKSSNIYWGFFESTKGYYGWAKRLHSGIVNDYVYWLVLVAVVLLVAVTLGGFAWA
ncbi:MAG: hydrogenase [Candidatus Diapherotrites archaeon]|nr:hydrogenase [Candidatus Diapherotrites archaeon]